MQNSTEKGRREIFFFLKLAPPNFDLYLVLCWKDKQEEVLQASNRPMQFLATVSAEMRFTGVRGETGQVQGTEIY